MRILFRTRPFYPSIGGLEAVIHILCEEFSELGHEVTVITQSLSNQPDNFTFKVLRQPSWFQIMKAHHEADIVLFGNISLWWCLTLCICPLPWVATHHGWYCEAGSLSWLTGRIKIAVARLASANISVSGSVNRFLGMPGIVIPNPFDHSTFHLMNDVARDRDLVFLGRLVSDKGADLLLEALEILLRRGLRPSLTVIGTGPEGEILERQADALGVSSQVSFSGALRGFELARTLNAHRIMVIPSRWHEPFGVVALEGIACGCVIVASSGGGLPEAVGRCGVFFRNSDSLELAKRLEEVLTQADLADKLRSAAGEHLARHERKRIAKAYLDVIEDAIV